MHVRVDQDRRSLQSYVGVSSVRVSRLMYREDEEEEAKATEGGAPDGSASQKEKQEAKKTK